MPPNRKGYYWEHREKCLENTKTYAEKNKEKIKEKQREYYHKVLKPQRQRDRLWTNADKPPKVKKEPVVKTTKRFFQPPIVLTAVPDQTPPALNGVTIKPGVVIDWA